MDPSRNMRAKPCVFHMFSAPRAEDDDDTGPPGVCPWSGEIHRLLVDVDQGPIFQNFVAWLTCGLGDWPAEAGTGKFGGCSGNAEELMGRGRHGPTQSLPRRLYPCHRSRGFGVLSLPGTPQDLRHRHQCQSRGYFDRDEIACPCGPANVQTWSDQWRCDVFSNSSE